MKAIIGATLAIILLAGCSPAVDSPENIPVRGLWTKEIKIGSFVVDGLTLDAEDLPKSELDGLLAFAEPESAPKCMEPYANDTQQVLDNIPSKFAKTCDFPQTAAAYGQLSVKSKCTDKQGPADIVIESNASQQAVTISSRISIPITSETGATNRVDISQHIKYKRVGDCEA